MKKITIDDIKSALSSDKFCFYYQPIISVITGELVGAEALIRWVEPDGTIIFPDRFIPIAEEHGFITDITFYMFDQFVSDVGILTSLNKNLNISINFSSKDLLNDKLTNKIEEHIISGNIDVENFSIEITEQSYVNYVDLNFDKYQRLNIEFVLDDYGIGFSNLAALINAPIKKIKIDRSIIHTMNSAKRSEIIINETIKLSHRLGLTVVAEGVENQSEYIQLQNNGCQYIQGYLISKAIKISDFISLFVLDKKQWQASALGIIRLAQFAHVQWKQDLINVTFHNVDDPFKNNTRTLINVDDYHSCSFGKWYYSDAAALLSENEYFIAIEQSHKDVHIIGSVLIEKSQEVNCDINEVINLSKELNKQSFILLKLLHDLEISLLIENIRN